jgi:hypothetical protein
MATDKSTHVYRVDKFVVPEALLAAIVVGMERPRTRR